MDGPMGRILSRLVAALVLVVGCAHTTQAESFHAPAQDVEPVAYFAPPPVAAAAPATVAAPAPVATASELTIIPPANALGSPCPSAVGVEESVVTPPSDAWCLPEQPPCRTSSWSMATEVIPTDSYVVHPDFGSWPDEDSGFSMRLIAGYEDPRGLGVRGRFWGLEQDVEAYSEDVEMRASAYDIDLYKRFFLEDSELVLGGGASGRSLKFSQEGNGYSKFRGNGLSMFVEGFVPLLEFPKSQLGQVGRARVSLTTGNWDDTTDPSNNIIPGTDHDSLTVKEFAWGLEYRRRFGELDDHSWYVAVMAEHQNWQSGWMENFLGSSVSFTGVNISTGISW